MSLVPVAEVEREELSGFAGAECELCDGTHQTLWFVSRDREQENEEAAEGTQEPGEGSGLPASDADTPEGSEEKKEQEEGDRDSLAEYDLDEYDEEEGESHTK